MSDDREQFARERRDAAARMAADVELIARAQAVSVDADRYSYSYQWTWLGLPIIQMPPDILALQELIWARRPQLIIETGIARGGSIMLEASILELVGEGRVLAVDIDIRPHNRTAIESHPLSKRIELVEGSSTDPRVVNLVKERAEGLERVMVVLDSDHSHDHVLAELRHYAPLVSPGQSLIVADTALEYIPPQAHRPRAWGPGNSPMSALEAYLQEDPALEADVETENKLLMTSSPGGYRRRRSRV
jgi:cephalosporin hydroxylase